MAFGTDPLPFSIRGFGEDEVANGKAKVERVRGVCLSRVSKLSYAFK